MLTSNSKHSCFVLMLSHLTKLRVSAIFWAGLVGICSGTWIPAVFGQPIPNPVGPGCWEWKYDPTKPIPSNAKVVPGVCQTPDGRCFVVPSSACFKLTGVEQPLFSKRPTPPPKPVDPPPGPRMKQPRAPFLPIGLRPLGPKHETATPLPERGVCSAGHGWDFETFLENVPGEIRGYASFDKWEGDGVAGFSPFLDRRNAEIILKAAPVYGNAVPIQRIKPPGWQPQIESQIGGDYWRFSQDVNQHGDFWIGSMDRRFSWKQHPGEMRDTWGENARGTVTSPPCELEARYLTFRFGGSSHLSQRVEVHAEGANISQYYGVEFSGGPGDLFGGQRGFPTQLSGATARQDFPPPIDESGWTIVRSVHPVPSPGDWMQVYVFDLAPFIGRKIRIRIVDDRRDECARIQNGVCVEKEPEHLLADDFVFTDAPPEGNEWMLYSSLDEAGAVIDGLCGGPGAGDGCSPIGHVASEPPLWGTTDVHAHPMANLAFGGHVMWGDVTDSLDQVYDCSRPLPAIPGPGGRPAIAPSAERSSCFLSGSVVAIATGALMLGCRVLNVVPFVGTALAVACTVVVTAAAAAATEVPVISGATLHGASKISSGAVKMGALFSGVLDILPDLSLDFQTGLIPQTDSLTHATGAEANGWWAKGENWHNPTGLGKTHNQYQADMIIRAYQGGLRLAVWDVINSRAFDLAVDGEMNSDWQALKDGTDGARRIIATRLNTIAAIALTPEDADGIIRSGKLAVILGSEVDELGRMRPSGMPWPRSPHSGADSMQKQVDDLWELGIRKITPVHATNNPIGGAALFNTIYDANNNFVSGTAASGAPSVTDLPDVSFSLDGTFGPLLSGLFLGNFSFIQDVVHPSAPAWNPTNFFDFDLRADRPEDKIIGDYDRVTYRIGIDGFHGTSLRNATGWLSPADVLGKQILVPRLIKGLSLAVTGSTCDLKDTTLPGSAASFGPAVDAHYTQMNGHRNALGLFLGDGENGETFIRAAMKKGMLLDTDHLSMNMRLDLYSLADKYATEAGWPRCRSDDGRSCGGYPFVGVHSKVRRLEIDPKTFDAMRNAYGYNDEASKTEREIKYVAENSGTIAVYPTGSDIIPPNTTSCTKDTDCASYTGPDSGACQFASGSNGHGSCKDVSPLLANRSLELPPEVSNDCDSTSKTFAIKYLWLLRVMSGHGLTPSTDFNGLASPLKPRYGTANPWSPACNGGDRDHTDQKPGPSSWYRMMVDSQEYEASGVWYDDYASRGAVTSRVGLHWGESRYKKVMARGAAEVREDRAPRAQVDDFVYYNDYGPDSPGRRGNEYQDGNRVGAQMYSMKRWRVLPGRAGWDYNLDGLQHIGLYPDLFQDMRNVGVQWEQMGPLFHAAQDYLITWRRGVAIGTKHP
jgi:hypothetical protein